MADPKNYSKMLFYILAMAVGVMIWIEFKNHQKPVLIDSGPDMRNPPNETNGQVGYPPN
jgi:hypothetical protein